MELLPPIKKSELNRLQKLIIYEKEARERGFLQIAGVDEAGRGPLAGPVVAAACVVPEGVFIPGANDSKKLTSQQREEIFACILADSRIQFGIGIVEHDEIDRINIYQATIVAMLAAIEKLPLIPDFLLVDGLALPHPSIQVQKIIKGDAKSQSIALASIIAKETRDKIMREHHLSWPAYGFASHKGYATPQHLEAIEKLGPCPIHRRSFSPIKTESLQLELFPLGEPC